MVILEDETFKKFGYYPRDLTLKSGKRVIAACDDCGKIREMGKYNYNALCRSCAKKGERATQETRRKLSEANKGKKLSLETRRKIADAQKGRTPTSETRKKLSDALKGEKSFNCGKHPSEETRKKLSDALKGEKNGNWRGGSSFGKYCPKFNKKFKEYIRGKFGRTCYICGKTEAENGKLLSVHHVNYDKDCGCAETEEDRKADDQACQFIPLCVSCHSKVHHDREKWERYFRNKMRNCLTGWYI